MDLDWVLNEMDGWMGFETDGYVACLMEMEMEVILKKDGFSNV